MKRLALLATSILALSLVACGEDNSKKVTPEAAATVEQTKDSIDNTATEAKNQIESTADNANKAQEENKEAVDNTVKDAKEQIDNHADEAKQQVENNASVNHSTETTPPATETPAAPITNDNAPMESTNHNVE